MTINRRIVLIALLIAIPFFPILSLTVLFAKITGIYVSEKLEVIPSVLYPIVVNIVALNDITKPLFRAKEPHRVLKAFMVILHLLSLVIILIMLMFLPLAFSQSTDY